MFYTGSRMGSLIGLGDLLGSKRHEEKRRGGMSRGSADHYALVTSIERKQDRN